MTATTAGRVPVGVPSPAARPVWPWATVLVVACLALAALSLLGPWALAFDPWAWLIWGREVTRLELDTSSGPSWKPLPVLFTTALAAAGDAAPELWAVVARAGGLLALAGAAALGRRLGGTAAGAAAALAMALGPWWLYNAALANSEGLLAAAVLWAVLAHLERRWGWALGLVVAAALLRPEVWPFLAGYAAWLWRGGQLPHRAILAGVAPVPVLWLGPDLLGAGGAFEAAHAARGTFSSESAALAGIPALAVVRDAVELVTVPATLAAAAALVWPGGAVRWLAGGAAAWVLLIAVETQLAGYAGNPRYLVPAAAIACVLGGVGAVGLGGRRWGAVGAGALVVAVAAVTAGTLRAQVADVGRRVEARTGLATVVQRAGGPRELRACAVVRTAQSQRVAVAWILDVPLPDIDDPAVAPAVLFRAGMGVSGQLVPPLPSGLRRVAVAPRWEVWARCG